jgi:hypothetical protein
LRLEHATLELGEIRHSEGPGPDALIFDGKVFPLRALAREDEVPMREPGQTGRVRIIRQGLPRLNVGKPPPRIRFSIAAECSGLQRHCQKSEWKPERLIAN